MQHNIDIISQLKQKSKMFFEFLQIILFFLNFGEKTALFLQVWRAIYSFFSKILAFSPQIAQTKIHSTFQNLLAISASDAGSEVKLTFCQNFGKSARYFGSA